MNFEDVCEQFLKREIIIIIELDSPEFKDFCELLDEKGARAWDATPTMYEYCTGTYSRGFTYLKLDGDGTVTGTKTTSHKEQVAISQLNSIDISREAESLLWS